MIIMHSLAYLLKGRGKMYKSAYFNCPKKTESSNEIRAEKLEISKGEMLLICLLVYSHFLFGFKLPFLLSTTHLIHYKHRSRGKKTHKIGLSLQNSFSMDITI